MATVISKKEGSSSNYQWFDALYKINHKIFP